MADNYIWFTWSLGLVVIWLIVFTTYRKARKRMLGASLLTMPFGLTEPLFVPEYWHPPSLFDLAHRTGFDIESLIFCFGIGGLGVVLYDLIFKIDHEKMGAEEVHHPRHRFHIWTLMAPVLIFPLLYFLTSWNVIYDATLSMFLAGLAALWCRPDLKAKIWVSGVLFLVFYAVYFLSLALIAPGYVEKVWTLSAISGIEMIGIPIEELLFAFTFGMLWSSYYEHLTWQKIKSQPLHHSKANTGQ
ncbi:MAG: lycopene cyclase domain-containing protein [Calditrichia bacterium]|nr:hypothetical protein [Calditrichota bacterium]MCB0266642.1 hypothetical protein [Calditrichota bacterium]MCB0285574.1 hypothetical protein [Calditrichota bacterium]MCB9067215.1 hypothetical protein [Calditrichia bacterium]